MAENRTDAIVGNEEEQVVLPITLVVEDAGPGRKRLRVGMRGEDVSREIERQVKEMRRGVYPGFRKGRAPARLIEKRFGADIRTGIRAMLVEQAIEKAVDEHKLELLGAPEMEQPEKAEDIVVEEGTDVAFSLTADVAPQVPVVDITGIKVRKPRIAVTDEHVDRAVRNLCDMEGTLVPVEDRGVQEGDHLTADVRVIFEGGGTAEQPGVSLQARPLRFMRALIQDFAQQVAGMNVGETRRVPVHVPDDHPAEQYRGRQLTLELALREIKRHVPAELNDTFLENLGFRNVDELRQALREELEQRVARETRRNMHEQIRQQLLSRIPLELPRKLTERQTERIIARRQASLRSAGASEEAIRENIEVIKQGAAEEATEELKASFILDKLAEQLEVSVTEAELNSEIASMAYREGVRPERLKQRLADAGLLGPMMTILREQKALDAVLEKVEIEEVEPTAEDQRAVVPTAATEETSLREPPAPAAAPQAEPAGAPSEQTQTPPADQTGQAPAAPA